MVRQKKVSEMQKDFINNLTHEFKTPLFTISMAADMIKKNQEPEKNRVYSQLIKKESAQLTRQVEKVLQHAIIDAGYFQMEKKEVDLKDIVEKVVASFSLYMEKNGGCIDILIHTSNSLIVGDEFHIYNVIFNLLDNAVKFSSQKPKIQIEVTEIEHALEIKVEDNGIGIHPSFHKRIFSKFYRPQGQGYKGFGLGLSYVKKVVEGHKGKIWFNSLPGKGSTFCFTLPTHKNRLYA
jgi:two-component system phosphate regulon sensor histidine kinase PhoR